VTTAVLQNANAVKVQAVKQRIEDARREISIVLQVSSQLLAILTSKDVVIHSANSVLKASLTFNYFNAFLFSKLLKSTVLILQVGC